MYKFFIFACVIVFIPVLRSAYASPPNAIHVFYEQPRSELLITVQHPVTNPRKHFVNKITVYKNGTEIFAEDFDFQTSHRNQTIPPIKLSAGPSDYIRIVASCNNSGSLERVVTVENTAKGTSRNLN